MTLPLYLQYYTYSTHVHVFEACTLRNSKIVQICHLMSNFIPTNYYILSCTSFMYTIYIVKQ